MLADKGILPVEKSLKVLTRQVAHCAFLPLDSYDIDMDLARSFPADSLPALVRAAV